MKKKGFLSLGTFLLLFGLTACPIGGGGGSGNGGDIGDGGGEVAEGSYMGTNDGHYKVDSKGNRMGKMEDHVLVDSDGDATHTPIAATCALPGRGYKKCTVCGRFVDYTIPKLAHDYQPSSDPAKAATCTTAGEVECSMCGDSKASGKPLGHLLTEEASGIDGVKKERCTRDGCTGGEVTLDVSKAAGWNKSTTKMNGTTAPDTPENKSTWNVAGVLEDGVYDIQIEGLMTYTSHGDRKWYNMAKPELCVNNTAEETATSNPDTTSQDNYRYYFKVNDSVEIDPTEKASWSELGFAGENDNGSPVYGYICKNVTISGATSFCLYHGNIGYSMIISNVKLIKH